MRASDPRTREILERTEALTRGGAHGAARDDPRVRAGAAAVSDGPESGRARAPGTRLACTSTGSQVRRGSRVRLRPRAGGDVFDLALDGRTAVVEGIERGHRGQRPARGHGRRRPRPRPRRAAPARAPLLLRARRGRAAGRARPRAARASSSPASATCSSATTASAWRSRGGSRRASCPAGRARSWTSGSAAWTSPTRCGGLRRGRAPRRHRRAASAPGTLYVIEPELDDGRRSRSTRTAWTR